MPVCARASIIYAEHKAGHCTAVRIRVSYVLLTLVRFTLRNPVEKDAPNPILLPSPLSKRTPLGLSTSYQEERSSLEDTNHYGHRTTVQVTPRVDDDKSDATVMAPKPMMNHLRMFVLGLSIIDMLWRSAVVFSILASL